MNTNNIYIIKKIIDDYFILEECVRRNEGYLKKLYNDNNINNADCIDSTLLKEIQSAELETNNMKLDMKKIRKEIDKVKFKPIKTGLDS